MPGPHLPCSVEICLNEGFFLKPNYFILTSKDHFQEQFSRQITGFKMPKEGAVSYVLIFLSLSNHAQCQNKQQCFYPSLFSLKVNIKPNKNIPLVASHRRSRGMAPSEPCSALPTKDINLSFLSGELYF